MPVRQFPHEGPLDLRRNLASITARRVGRVPKGDGRVWWVTVTPDGPATTSLVLREGRVEAEAWGDGSAWALEHVADVTGLRDDPSSFDPPHGFVSEMHRRFRGLRLGRTGRVFEALLPAILGQRVTAPEAIGAYRSIVRTYGTRAPGPVDLWAPPHPATIARLSYGDLHRHGVERRRAEVLIESARRARRLEETASMDLAAAESRLRAVRGIGPWTAAMVLGSALGDPDAVPVGDYHLPDIVAWTLAGEERADDRRMLELLEPYRGQRRRAIALIMRSGITPPRFGPRRAGRDIATQ